MAQFVPRGSFPQHTAIARSYYLGHHRAGLRTMKSMLSSIDYVVECRDYRVPVTSINPMFEEALGNKQRVIVYTKKDLGNSDQSLSQKLTERKLRSFDPQGAVFFTSSSSTRSSHDIINHLRKTTEASDRIVGTRLLVVGMPNIGKSTLINNLRNAGVGKSKTLKTGAQPGITRKVATQVKIINHDSGSHVYMLDTPGVFMPYVPDSENMLKLALCGCVKDQVIEPITLADYVLYHVNLHDPTVYKQWSEPTNEIVPLLENLARQTGQLKKGGIPNIDAAALLFLFKWRHGEIGRFLLDDLELEEKRREHPNQTNPMSMRQALRAQRGSRKNKPLESNDL